MPTQTGLHTLVDGLAITSPTSPSPPPTSSANLNNISSLFSGSPPPSYGNTTTSYDSANNSDDNPQSDDPQTGDYDEPTAGSSSSHAVPRLHSIPLPSRRINYGMSPNGRMVDKVVDDFSMLSVTGDRGSKLSSGRASPMSPGQHGKPLAYKGSDFQKLEDFLYTRGFLEGACSDIVVVAFGRKYKLHRLILDRSPFFSCFFNGPWVETSSQEITINPNEVDPNITKEAFELALSRLYGRQDEAAEAQHALSLLATASYLDLQDLADFCVKSILENMTTKNIPKLINFVTSSYYGHLGERILSTAKSLLYREGWEMSPPQWDGISGEIVAEIAGYDGFFVPSEMHRYLFVKDLLNSRLSQLDEKKGGTIRRLSGNPKGKSKLASPSRSDESLVIVEGDSESTLVDSAEEEDIRPIRELLETGIYYMHLSFEELQRIADDRDVRGQRIVSDDTIKNALWNQMLLRQKVLNAPFNSPELGITQTLPIPAGTHFDEIEEAARGVAGDVPLFMVPMEDSTTIIAGDSEQFPPNHHNPSSARNSGTKNSLGEANNTLDLNDMSSSPQNGFEPREVRFSSFPPFRFSAEFRSIKSLREKKRVYSKTVFYAGSYWNIYIQKVKPSKQVQLGVYLHRAKEPTSSHNNSINTIADLTLNQAADERVGQFDTTRNSSHFHGEGDEGHSSGGEAALAAGSAQANSSAPRWQNQGGTAASASPSPVQTVASYTDSRPMIQTYFKIFSPSKKGKLLSMFSSEPDSFNFSQSWGWKSSTLILDEQGGLENEEGKLRFMVVLGNV